jgi:hypothetical protein
MLTLSLIAIFLNEYNSFGCAVYLNVFYAVVRLKFFKTFSDCIIKTYTNQLIRKLPTLI